MLEPFLSFLEGTLRSGLKLAAPLWLSASGEAVAERAGVLNIGLEGMMLTGAFAGMVTSFYTGNPWLGLLAGMGAAMLLAAGFGVLTVYWGADQIITGAGLNLLALGISGFLFRSIFGVTGAALTVESFRPVRFSALERVPLLGWLIADQPALLYPAMLVVPVTAVVLARTRLGLAIRACGEHAAAADTAGIDVFRLRFLCVLFCGAMCGAAGAYLSLAHAGTFIEGMTAGRGFIALALVIFGRWRPWRILAVSLLFGCANAMQYQLQALGSAVPYELFLMLPYVLTLVVLALAAGRSWSPAELARPYERL